MIVLYAGRLTLEKGADLLADAFLAARARDPRLRLVLAGGGPEEARLRERLGDAATFRGGLAAIRDPGWDAALARLAGGWRRALSESGRAARAA